MIKQWSDKAWNGLSYWINHDRKITGRILMLIEDIDRNGYKGYGKPEPLKGDLSGYWSRRIDKENRLVYQIESDRILIIQCGTHYGDK